MRTLIDRGSDNVTRTALSLSQSNPFKSNATQSESLALCQKGKQISLTPNIKPGRGATQYESLALSWKEEQ